MDPVTIITTIGAVANGALTLTFQLYTFIDDTKHVNQTVTDLVQEVNALISILRAVKLGLENDPAFKAERLPRVDDDPTLWKSILDSLKDCQETVDKLEKAIEDVRPEGSNFASQAVRRIRLNLKDTEIKAFHERIRTHTNALQIALSMVNLRAAYLAPGAVIDELGPKIAELQGFMELVYGSEAELRTKSLGIEPAYLKGLRQSADRVISGATTVGATSVAAHSINGDIMDEEKRDKTLSWIQQNPGIPEEHEGLGLEPPPSESHSGSQMTPLMLPVDSGDIDTDSDSDGDFTSEEVDSFFARGTEKFQAGNFRGAQETLQQGLELAQKLPLKRRQPAQIADVKLMVATCIYHSSDLKEAEARLIPITRDMLHENETDKGAIRRCQASHLLAGVLFRQGRYSFRQGRYSDAEPFCRKAYLGRRRILGKDHTSTYETLSLLSEICEANNQPQRAENYWAMIPKDIAPTLIKVKDQFPATRLQIQLTNSRINEPADNTVPSPPALQTRSFALTEGIARTSSPSNHRLSTTSSHLSIQPLPSETAFEKHSPTFSACVPNRTPTFKLSPSSTQNSLFTLSKSPTAVNPTPPPVPELSTSPTGNGDSKKPPRKSSFSALFKRSRKPSGPTRTPSEASVTLTEEPDDNTITGVDADADADAAAANAQRIRRQIKEWDLAREQKIRDQSRSPKNEAVFSFPGLH